MIYGRGGSEPVDSNNPDPYPWPAVYMEARNKDRWLAVDGLQRLSTIKRFVTEKNLKLTGLQFLTHSVERGMTICQGIFKEELLKRKSNMTD